MSDGESIGRWTQNSIVVGHYNMSSNPSFPFVGSAANATVKWNAALPPMISIFSGTSGSTIPAYGGSTAQLAAQGLTLSDTFAGLCHMTAYQEGYWYFGSSAKSGNIMVSAKFGIVDFGSNLTTSQYTSIATHELGHALGWMNHSFSQYDIMWPSVSSITVLTTAEKLHLSQIY